MEQSSLPGKKKHKGLRIFGFILLFFLALAIAAAIFSVLWYKKQITAIEAEKCAGENCQTSSFVIDEGESTTSIANKLEQEGIIRSALAFRIYMKLEATDQTLKTGTYSLSKDMDVKEIVKRFNEGAKAKTFRITFLPGGTMTAVRGRLLEAGYKAEEIDAAFKKQYDHPLLKSKPASASLEGYVYGDTYEFYASASVEDVLVRTFDEMYQVVKDNGLEAKYKSKGLTLHQGITLASVVQGEAGVMSAADQQTVAQVFLTRLSKNIVLGSDAIIAYYANQANPNRDKSDMSYLETTPCPWNSRKCQGLPPTPISSPGKTALLAAANPSNTDYLYFISGYDADGKVKMYYAHTAAEHEANIRNYCGDLCEIF